jgi:Fe(3+) dicitrate transport protein
MSSPVIFKRALLSAAILSVLSAPALAEEGNIEHLTVFGSQTEVNDAPGSAHMLSADELAKFDYSDIMRALTSVPGVYVMEEDGYGLRPNIGMRGTGQNRSEKVTIMEDAVLAAPAPYAAPSAYYFPTAGRMQQVEVLKGTSSAKFGPRTTGGVLNMLSRQIPDAPLAGMVDFAAGEDGFAKAHGYIGGAGEQIASVFEVYRYQADGFKDINHTDKGTGFVKNDFLSKVRFNSAQGAEFYQELEFKLKYSDEDSDETYVGLTDEDFDANPYQRYSVSQEDNMSTEHKQFQVNHYIELNNRMSLGSSAYYNDFHRNWYKAKSVDVDEASAWDKGEFNGQESLGVSVKANNRGYISKGVQTQLSWDLNDHQLEIGARYHEDEMDRFQWVDEYELGQDYQMTLVEAGVPGTDSNRIDSAEAVALFVTDEITFGDFVFNAGLRYEDMTIKRKDWGKSNPGRDGEPSKNISNSLDVWLPSLAFTYKVNDELILLGGVQKGFAPPAPGNAETEEEESVNYELGLRFTQDAANIEALVFFSDYDNMHGNCTESQSCSDDNVGNQYNAGEVETKGLELKAGYEFNLGQFAMPIDLTYTYTSTEFLTSFESDFEPWGDVEAGDELPYVPENQLQFSAGLVGDNLSTYINVRYMDEMRSEAGSGDIPEGQGVDSRTVVDLASRYEISESQQISLTVDNLFDKEYATTRTHGSLMVGKPRTVTLGYRVNF